MGEMVTEALTHGGGLTRLKVYNEIIPDHSTTSS